MPLHDVTVTLRELETSAIVARTTTAGSGTYAFDDVPEGRYQLDFCRSGFNTLMMKVYVRTHAGGRPLDVMMRVSN